MKNSEKKALGKSVLNTSLSFFKGIASGINPVLGAVVESRIVTEFFI